MKNKKGFTLIELLVVIAIIALLMSIVVPSLRKVKEQARRTICATQLRQWGVSIQNYSNDNKGQLLKTVDTWGAGPEGLICWSTRTTSPGASKEFNLDAIGPYLPGFDAYSINISDIWLCPSNTMDYSVITKTHFEVGFLVMQYSYWARTDLWETGIATHKKQLVGKSLTSQQVVMADTCFRLAGGGYLYNHGTEGSSVHRKPELFGGQMDMGPPKITGLNRCYGDGRVEWRSVGEYYDPVLMNDHGDRTQPRVISGNESFY